MEYKLVKKTFALRVLNKLFHIFLFISCFVGASVACFFLFSNTIYIPIIFSVFCLLITLVLFLYDFKEFVRDLKKKVIINEDHLIMLDEKIDFTDITKYSVYKRNNDLYKVVLFKGNTKFTIFKLENNGLDTLSRAVVGDLYE